MTRRRPTTSSSYLPLGRSGSSGAAATEFAGTQESPSFIALNSVDEPNQ